MFDPPTASPDNFDETGEIGATLPTDAAASGAFGLFLTEFDGGVRYKTSATKVVKRITT